MTEISPAVPSTVTDLPPIPDWSRHALFLDFDGTLAPLVDRPEDVVMGDLAADILRAAMRATDGAVAVISGRKLDDLAAMLGGVRLPLSGSHGVEVRLPQGAAGSSALPDGAALDAVHDRLSPLARSEGLLLERKPGAVALHYRNRPELGEDARQAVAEAAMAAGLRVLHGNMVSEAAFDGIDKGTALAGFLDHPPFSGRLPVMIGDDTTDEDGFAAAQRAGGFGLRIGGTSTCARYRVGTMDEALAWLAGTLDLAE